MKVLSILGTRPEAIKLAPIIRELQTQADQIESRVCVTAQHRDMLDQVLQLFDIVPDYDLDVMAENQSPAQVASKALAKLEPVIRNEQPDWVLVQGDTTTAAAASLAAFYARVRVGHVEAGLRSFDKHHPFPEEINRRIASVIADLHFAPTESSRSNLLREGIPSEHIFVTGNPVIDALRWALKQPLLDQPPAIEGLVLDHVGPKTRAPRLILVTAHRRENIGQPLMNICQALVDIAGRYEEHVQIIYPVHRNPNIWGPVHRFLGNIPNIALIPPLDYFGLVQLMRHSYLVLTDSGGIQEEAPGLGIPVLVLRETTERPEGVEAGTARIVGTDTNRIVSETALLLDDATEHHQMARAVNPYGDGMAALRIVHALLNGTVEMTMPAESLQIDR